MKRILILLLLQQSFVGNAQLYTPNQAVSATTNPTTGNVGIGTTNPTQKLEVAGGGRFVGGRLSQTGTIPNDNNAAFWNYSTTGYGLYSQGGSGNLYAFHFLNRDGATILYGRGDGNVGVGTYYPDAKLTVKGGIHAEEVRVDLNVPAPDYVFEAAYKLPSLQEIERYIKQNKHLPEVPSAKEMEKDGIKLSEMNMILLKKVEELTLHMIEQNKTIDLQQKQIKALQTEISLLQKRAN